MSEFFYKERLGGTFSPVINIKKPDEISSAVLSAIDNLLSPCANMFTKANSIKNLMKTEKMSLEAASKALSLKPKDVADKLRLLEFSDKEKSAILDCEFPESTALLFLNLDKTSRLYVMEYCHRSGFCEEEIKSYIEDTVLGKTQKKKSGQVLRKFAVCDVGFLLNSIENALNLAKKAGFDVTSEKSESDTAYNIHICVKKEKTKGKS